MVLYFYILGVIMANLINSSTDRVLDFMQQYVRMNGTTPKNLFHLFPQAVRTEILSYAIDSITPQSSDDINVCANLDQLAPDLKDMIKVVDKIKVRKLNAAPWDVLKDSIDEVPFNAFKKFVLRNSSEITSLYISDAVVGKSSDLVPPQTVSASDILDVVAPCVNLRRLRLTNMHESNLKDPFLPDDMARLVSIRFQNLETLSLRAVAIDMDQLVSSVFLRQLSNLDLTGCDLTNKEFSLLVNSKIATDLINLNVSSSDLIDDVSTLFQTPLSRLETLDLSENFDISDLSGFPGLKNRNILPSLIAIRVFSTDVTQGHVDSITFPDIAIKMTIS